MAPKRERKTERKIEAGGRAQARRSADALAEQDGGPKLKKTSKPAHLDTRSMVSLVVRRMGKNDALTKTLAKLSAGAANAIEELYRLAALELLVLSETETMFREVMLDRLRPTDGQKVDLQEAIAISQELRAFATNRNRAIQTALQIRKQHSDENVGEGDDKVTFGMGDVVVAQPTLAPPPEYADSAARKPKASRAQA